MAQITEQEIDARVDELMADLGVRFAPVGVAISDLLRDTPPLIALFIVLRQATADVLARVPLSHRADYAESLADDIVADAKQSLD
jgi:uncharacterized protein YqfA (UPF0365 family)